MTLFVQGRMRTQFDCRARQRTPMGEAKFRDSPTKSG